ncbi:hypothetical protein [Pseudoalteromonas denitrificans]|uniref:Lipoprotein n=1 Tax=Pseudoalteromonas denitrificans DSM 6059 TaxID=1123010 RepID=A0A1I1RSR0_9GAMM|nr:hypothetical protein [Pseudoalteromonas denitrificans]SFD34693.1 hypothetical protein SAMN02745724_04267 [Pseudoalteromonas denitrificans DSM 6059]
MKKSYKSNIQLAVLGCVLSGCVSSPHTKYASEQHLLGVSEDSDGYFVQYKNSFDDPSNSGLASLYLQRGMSLSRAACDNYLDSLTSKDKNHNWMKGQFLTATVLGTGMLVLNKASTESIEKLVLGTAFVTSSMDLYQNYYLLGPGGVSVAKLVRRAMDSAKHVIDSTPGSDFDTVHNQLKSYSAICSSSEIDIMVSASVEAAKVTAVVEPEKQTSETHKSLQVIAEMFNKITLTGPQYTGLYWATVRGFANQNEKLLITQVLGNEVPLAAISDANIEYGRNIAGHFRKMNKSFLQKYEANIEQLIMDANKVATEAAEKHALSLVESELDKNAQETAIDKVFYETYDKAFLNRLMKMKSFSYTAKPGPISIKID